MNEIDYLTKEGNLSYFIVKNRNYLKNLLDSFQESIVLIF